MRSGTRGRRNCSGSASPAAPPAEAVGSQLAACCCAEGAAAAGLTEGLVGDFLAAYSARLGGEQKREAAEYIGVLADRGLLQALRRYLEGMLRLHGAAGTAGGQAAD